VKTFEQRKARIGTEYKRNEAERLFTQRADQLADAALQNATDIDVVAKKAGLTVQDIANFPARIDGAGRWARCPRLSMLAFSQDVLDGRLSPHVEVEKRPRRLAARHDHNGAAAKSRSRLWA